MTGFMVGVAVLILGTLLLLLPPLMRGGQGGGGQRREALNLAVLRHQSRELEAEHAAGLLGAEEYAQAREELERRVAEEVRPEAVAETRGASRWTGIAVGTLLPMLAAALYLGLGSPAAFLQDQADPHAAAPEAMSQQVESMVAGLAQRMQQDPDNAEGWRMLARSYNVLGRYAQAAEAYARLVKLKPDDSAAFADYADTLAMAQGQSLQGEPERLVERALALDPANLKALSLAGSAAFERGDYAEAERRWRKMLPLAEPDSEIGRNAAAGIAEAQRRQAQGGQPAR
ncbi:c-type cytochrome biogenesis protein CcmI [Noviherbaspirillum aridicola]|uniref:Cytochrome c-type biogenesis protein H TPR domain-containing protein n=1 Tax=Noviherbaspirillum aridicola TaxID=2849687 RepID=A0ABQ4Q6P7_9BURK|nr:c-type cytochrome biogenesis protein CcmI [Noviherbaspirillum aridicola]GIZ52712.1 hypothetical protein NCCP691_27260 [Noviherbaspirillum aridicola]